MMFTDTVEVTSARITRDGYLVADAKIARTGIQSYLGSEVGKPEMPSVKVYRPADEVFAADAMSSFAHRPITLDHPAENVTADNWKRLAVGDIGAEIVRDGEFIRVPMKVMDRAAVESIRSGRQEFSAGYSCTLDWTPGTFDGQAYDAVQRDIRANHVAAVAFARGGSELRIIDERASGDRTVATKIITFDGLPIETTDAAEAVIRKLEGNLANAITARDTASTEVGTLKAAVSTKDGEIVALKAQLADATVTPAKLTEMVAARSKVVDAAKTLAPTLVTDGKTDAEIRRAAVSAKLGDAATAMDDAAIGGAFAAFTAGAATTDPVRLVIDGGVTSIADARGKAAAAHTTRNEQLRNAYKAAPAA